RDFFVRNDLVVSGCFNFPVGSSNIGHRSKYVRLRLKVPIKCYVGFKKRKDKQIVIKDVVFYNLSKKTYESSQFSEINKESARVIRVLEDMLAELDLEHGYDVEILSESSRGHSLGFSGTSSVLIITALHILAKKLSTHIFEKYDEFMKTDVFQDIFYKAWELDLISRYGNSIGENIIYTLSNNNIPFFFYTEQFDKTIDPKTIRDVSYWFAPVVDSQKQGDFIIQDMPFDYYMVFSGIPTDTKKVEEYKKADYDEFETKKDFIKNEIIAGNTAKNIYIKKFIEKGVDIVDSYADVMGLLNIKMIRFFKEITKKGYDAHLIEGFIDHINSYRHTMGLFEKQSSFASDFTYSFKKNQCNTEEKLGIMPAYSGKIGGGYVMITKPGISRDTIEKTIQDLRSVYPNIEIEYGSHLDGNSSDGVVVEQYISGGVYSDYVDKNKFLFQSNKGDNYIGDYSEILEKEQNGLLFDMINNKIYLNGEKLTSKDIPSQNTTIEVVTRLLEHIGEELSNKDLPNSSYSSSKNEMLGKIILPLVRLIEERTGERLPLVCKGGLNDFYIKMGDIHIKIGAIKRI
ncbi:MAG: hypothetical protein Q8K26_02705, partial [Candidatus Gracilibacteria bacterium]|nr:hypothetical protein [Candidatus Gracilibacteria bacterium]